MSSPRGRRISGVHVLRIASSSYCELQCLLREKRKFLIWLWNQAEDFQPWTVKVKANPLQAWADPEGSRSLRFPDFKTVGTWTWQVCQPYAPAAFTSMRCPWYSFLLEAESTPGPKCFRKDYGTIGNRTRDLPACSAVPQPTAPPRTPNLDCALV